MVLKSNISRNRATNRENIVAIPSFSFRKPLKSQIFAILGQEETLPVSKIQVFFSSDRDYAMQLKQRTVSNSS